jgi:hypothetical protein
MVKKRGLIIATFLLLGIFLFSNFVSAAGTSFDTAEEIQFDESGNAVVQKTILGDDTHYYSYSAYKGDDVKLTFIGAPSESDGKYLNLKIKTYNNKFERIRKSNLLHIVHSIFIQDGIEERKEKSFLASWSGKRYIELYIGRYYATAGGDYEIRITKTCREGYSDELRKCEDGKWIEKPIKDFLTGQDISASECKGCIFSGYCYNLGQNFSLLDGTKKYCSFDKEVVSAKTIGKDCMESYECASPLTCAEGKCYDLREVKDEETGDTIYAKDCKTNCIVDEVCYAIGNRFKDGNESASYCSVRKTIESQKEEEKLCSENYECFSNECSKGVCIDTIGFIQSIVNWFKSIFGLEIIERRLN